MYFTLTAYFSYRFEDPFPFNLVQTFYALKILRKILIPINFHKFFGDILTKTSFCFTDDSMSSWGSGSSVLDLIFPQPETISEIRFRNWYTARLSILVRFDDSVQAPPKSSSLNWAAAAVSTSIVLMKIIYLYLLHKHM